MPAIKVGSIVFDRWWPGRLGSVVKLTKCTTTVVWTDGESWKYDRDHRQFIEYFTKKKHKLCLAR